MPQRTNVGTETLSSSPFNPVSIPPIYPVAARNYVRLVTYALVRKQQPNLTSMHIVHNNIIFYHYNIMSRAQIS